MLYSVDRFEGEMAVLLDDGQGELIVARTQLPAQTKPSSIVRNDHGVWTLDEQEAQRRRESISSKLQSLWE